MSEWCEQTDERVAHDSHLLLNHWADRAISVSMARAVVMVEVEWDPVIQASLSIKSDEGG